MEKPEKEKFLADPAAYFKKKRESFLDRSVQAIYTLLRRREDESISFERNMYAIYVDYQNDVQDSREEFLEDCTKMNAWAKEAGLSFPAVGELNAQDGISE